MNSSVASDIFLTGFFPHKSFPMMYAGSEACVFPSVNEGVGLPILEAMATGVPVLCSKSGALPEIAGDAAYYFDSDNIEEIATGLERIVTDNELRSTLTNKGIERVEAFSSCSTALAYATENPVDVAFLDINMRGIGGLGLAEKLIELQPRCKIVFCTGYEEYAIPAFKIHASGYLMKPISGCRWATTLKASSAMSTARAMSASVTAALMKWL